MDGYIKLYRVLIDKPIWLNSTPEHKSILITLLLMANHKNKQWEWGGEQFKVAPGQFITSLESIRQKAGKGISIQNIRSSLIRFEKLQFATSKATKRGRLITIINWDSYQSKQFKPTKKPTKEQQRSNKGATPNKNERMKEVKIYSRVVDYFNRKTNSNFKPNTIKTKELIDERTKEGFSTEDFKTVIDFKCNQWLADGEKQEFLRPITLFSSKFEGYLNAAQREKRLNNIYNFRTDEEIAEEKRRALL
jgi:uncharacterized phage protein (TIGR02220 family)